MSDRLGQPYDETAGGASTAAPAGGQVGPRAGRSSALPAPVLPGDLRGAQVLGAVRADPHADYRVASGEDVVGVLRGFDAANLLNSKETAR